MRIFEGSDLAAVERMATARKQDPPLLATYTRDPERAIWGWLTLLVAFLSPGMVLQRWTCLGMCLSLVLGALCAGFAPRSSLALPPQVSFSCQVGVFVAGRPQEERDPYWSDTGDMGCSTIAT